MAAETAVDFYTLPKKSVLLGVVALAASLAAYEFSMSRESFKEDIPSNSIET